MDDKRTWTISVGGWLMIAAAFIGLLLSLYNYFDTGNGISHSPGALLVVVSSGLVLAAALVITLDHDKPAWLTGFLYIGVLLGVLGTGLAAWFLAALWLVLLMAVALAGWIVHLIWDPSDETLAEIKIRKEVLS